MSEIKALPVKRDQYGCWTHPEYEKFCAGREFFPTSEFDAWTKANGLEWAISFLDENEFGPDICPEISAWEPEAPEGDGWFVGSIHDTEDGAVCVWLRNKGGAA
ncbi:hypothetical protein ACGANB_04070 [Salmonella enterica subsp. enterica serovar Aberdeen]|uniref:hypothetical protein n=1 Tax=Salmonella enterica TaxID=28901 RepID=UPI0012C5C67B|nr:hypothetical protein [Salmonella enterica subsp. enterica serovar Kottbus]EDW9123523.1 hypothetical protein [Salmonella enterica subsp. enterica serovar Braenderup]EEL6457177.1 hypothetical protein [Salmonella enterica subsp. enterica serovar Kottbus]HBB6732334.1 hypothetical protein [Salmonella enterica]